MQRLADCITHWARSTPENTAIADAHVCWNYRVLEQMVDEAGRYLLASNIRPGDRVVMIGENSAALAVLILAAGRVNAWAVLENARQAPAEVDAVCEHAQARRIIYVVDNSSSAQEHADRHGAIAQATPFGRIALGALNDDCEREPVHEEPHRQVAALIYTTGSTGTPKGVMLTHANLLHIGALMRDLRRVTPADHVYGVLPITHVMGLSSGLIGTLSAGARITLIPRFSVQPCLQALQRDGITILQGAPAMFAKLAKSAEPGHRIDASLRFIAVGGAPLDPALKTEVETVFGLPLHNGYGLTEASASCWTRIDLDNPDSAVGPPNPGMEVRIWNAAGKQVADGEVGELWVRGPCVMKGYYRAPDLTAKALTPDGWFNTQDLASQRPDGRIHIEGRTKDLIIHSGFNVSPLEVETALNAHASVQYSAVLGYMIDGNEEIIAIVEPIANSSLAEDDLRRFLAPRLSPYKRPTRILFMQTLPVAPNGKVLKHQLRKKLGEML
ncbi:acyl--CoA ligase [Paralcaligenes sp. KSB-10]|uniref:class I adenylate-forming enzyme family protein n=1 Tax=Paralcaligenes sp. KSB-10 TaxID=2901142 RepID=UPI001E5BF591|nr:class I adenylate-forming enzyme family protein [Paralcaligenes sp. KSB-10]UHL63545.1 acyl--CoA ligase [Paralcaligenes sp. KSB-10]